MNTQDGQVVDVLKHPFLLIAGRWMCEVCAKWWAENGGGGNKLGPSSATVKLSEKEEKAEFRIGY